MAEVPNQPLKPGRRSFLKAMAAITGATMLPSALAGPLLAPEVAVAPVMPESLLTPVSGIRGMSVFLNGMMMQEGVDWVQTGDYTAQFISPPAPGDMITVSMPFSRVGCRKMADGKSPHIFSEEDEEWLA